MSSNAHWRSLSDAVHKAVKALERKNITHTEAFYTSTKTIEVTIRNSEILTQNKLADSGVGFRVVVEGNKVGFACTNMSSEKAVLEAGKKAFDIANLSSKIPHFALPEARKPPKVRGLFDSEVADVKVEEAIDIAMKAIKAAEDYDKRVIAKDGRVLFTVGCRGVTNTLGVDFEEEETKALIYLGGSGKQNGEVTSGCYDIIFSRFADLNPEHLGDSVGKKVTDMFKPRPLKSFQGTAIFGPEAVSDQLAEVMIDGLKGETAIAKRSTWTGKIGQMVTSENLTVIDNAVLEKGFSSRSFDDEGCSSQQTTLINRGKLESFLHNATSASTLKTRNTGNASRSAGGFDIVDMIIGHGYRTKPQIYPSNLVIQPGSTTREELISETSEGVLIESMAGFPQAGSGIVSAQLSRAFYINNGEVKYPIKGGMVSGVAFDWFQQISGVGNDSKQFSNAVVPSLRVENVKIVGA